MKTEKIDIVYFIPQSNVYYKTKLKLDRLQNTLSSSASSPMISEINYAKHSLATTEQTIEKITKIELTDDDDRKVKKEDEEEEEYEDRLYIDTAHTVETVVEEEKENHKRKNEKIESRSHEKSKIRKVISKKLEATKSNEGGSSNKSKHQTSSLVAKMSCTVPNCDRTFRRRSEMLRHIAFVHTKARHLACPFADCSQRFVQNGDRNKHIVARHSTNKPWRCTFGDCQRRWADRSALARHVRTTHLGLPAKKQKSKQNNNNNNYNYHTQIISGDEKVIVQTNVDEEADEEEEEDERKYMLKDCL